MSVSPRVLVVMVLIPVVAGCYDREKCQPKLWGPVGDWHFIALDEGVVMANRLFDGWQKVKGCCEPWSVEYEYDGLDRPWLLVAGSPASYGLRFSTKTTAACDPRWPSVSIDGESVATRVKRRTIFEDNPCGSPHVDCPADGQYEEVDDVVWDWAPSKSGYSTVEFEWGGYKRTLRMLIAEPETAPPVVEIPAKCRRVQRVDEETWLCDRVAYRNGVATQSWPDTSLLAGVGEAAVVEWGGNRVRLWRFDGGAAAVTADLDAGVSPEMRWDGGHVRYFDRDDIFVLDGGRVLLDAAREVVFLDDALGAAPSLSRREFGAQVGSVRGQLVSVAFQGGNKSLVCLGFGDATDRCEEVPGVPGAMGDDGLWLLGGVWGSNYVSAVSFSETGALLSSSVLLAEDNVPAEDGSFDTQGSVPRKSDGGEQLHGHLRRARMRTQQGGCLFYDVHRDGGLIPRIYPEVGGVEPPLVNWNVVEPTYGDGDGDWRWCVKKGAGVTYVYRAPPR